MSKGKWKLSEGATFYLLAFLAVFFFFFTRPAPANDDEGKESSANTAQT
ncbi:hypothetical protein [Sulfoacidibacillus ferrooxidans]|uniref:Uncharacterized protein n=1 Tax=Sulfoacidibacillus ferrooxidans TaxID=2005001 RepID=A0A9X1V6G5_9BACL|nr:hypothetical protein [Sulfoacidibacillus ferrooxidans]MCI0181834.1 hypothetical protein [Sulfoacidibacillus ferrooxidans]